MSIEEAVLEKMLALDSDRKQQVLDFVEFLQYRQYEVHSNSEEVSAWDAAQKVLGAIGDGPPDLSTNKRYMEGFGQ